MSEPYDAPPPDGAIPTASASDRTVAGGQTGVPRRAAPASAQADPPVPAATSAFAPAAPAAPASATEHAARRHEQDRGGAAVPRHAREAVMFPFSALVGLDDLKLALQLAAVDSRLSVLARGDKGAGKTTAVRALGRLLGDRAGHAAPFVNLPLGATEDRLLGGLDVARALAGEPALKPGLLAEAHGGVLYVDEVNLLPEHLADALLDAVASGHHVVEREGFSLRQEAQFALIGSMNPEEGALRPQLLDRFALAVDVSAPMDARRRRQAVERRLEFDARPEAFVQAWRVQEAALAERLRAARTLLETVSCPSALLDAISDCVCAEGVRSLRADLAIVRAGRAFAALEGASEVTARHVDAVLPLALYHRSALSPRRPSVMPAKTFDDESPAASASPSPSRSESRSSSSSPSQPQPQPQPQPRSQAPPPESTSSTESARASSPPSSSSSMTSSASASGSAPASAPSFSSRSTRTTASSRAEREGDAAAAQEAAAANEDVSEHTNEHAGADEDQDANADASANANANGDIDTGSRGPGAADGAADTATGVEAADTRGAQFDAGEPRVFTVGTIAAPRLALAPLAFADADSEAGADRSDEVTALRGSSRAAGAARGPVIGSRRTDAPGELDMRATLVHAVARTGAPRPAREDLHETRRAPQSGTRFIFVIDASGSHAVQQRMRLVKGAVSGLLDTSLKRHDEVVIVAFRGAAAEVIVEPTRDAEAARLALAYLPTGGRTPLAHALELAAGYVTAGTVLVLLTDGRANVPSRSDDAWSDALRAAAAIACPAIVIDSEPGTRGALSTARAAFDDPMSGASRPPADGRSITGGLAVPAVPVMPAASQTPAAPRAPGTRGAPVGASGIAARDASHRTSESSAAEAAPEDVAPEPMAQAGQARREPAVHRRQPARFDRARAIADAMRAVCVPLDGLDEIQLVQLARRQPVEAPAVSVSGTRRDDA